MMVGLPRQVLRALVSIDSQTDSHPAASSFANAPLYQWCPSRSATLAGWRYTMTQTGDDMSSIQRLGVGEQLMFRVGWGWGLGVGVHAIGVGFMSRYYIDESHLPM
jgi:hypothetical protein